MKFYEELEQLNIIRNQSLNEFQKLKVEEQIELEEASARIRQKYLELSKSKYQELRKNNDRMDSYCQMLADYSSFDARDIGVVLASLIKTFEGINYVYQDTYYDKKETKQLVFDKEETDIRTRLRIIVIEEYKSKFYSEDEIDSLIKTGKAIILSSTKTFGGQILFYRADVENHSLEQCVKWEKFSYIKDFIDGLISHKLEKKTKHISRDELEKAKIDFIAKNVKHIEDHYRIIAAQKAEQMQENLNIEYEIRQARLRKLLESEES